jgi:hypothetical protein
MSEQSNINETLARSVRTGGTAPRADRARLVAGAEPPKHATGRTVAFDTVLVSTRKEWNRAFALVRAIAEPHNVAAATLRAMLMDMCSREWFDSLALVVACFTRTEFERFAGVDPDRVWKIAKKHGLSRHHLTQFERWLAENIRFA